MDEKMLIDKALLNRHLLRTGSNELGDVVLRQQISKDIQNEIAQLDPDAQKRVMEAIEMEDENNKIPTERRDTDLELNQEITKVGMVEPPASATIAKAQTAAKRTATQRPQAEASPLAEAAPQAETPARSTFKEYQNAIDALAEQLEGKATAEKAPIVAQILELQKKQKDALLKKSVQKADAPSILAADARDAARMERSARLPVKPRTEAPAARAKRTIEQPAPAAAKIVKIVPGERAQRGSAEAKLNKIQKEIVTLTSEILAKEKERDAVMNPENWSRLDIEVQKMIRERLELLDKKGVAESRGLTSPKPPLKPRFQQPKEDWENKAGDVIIPLARELRSKETSPEVRFVPAELQSLKGQYDELKNWLKEVGNNAPDHIKDLMQDVDFDTLVSAWEAEKAAQQAPAEKKGFFGRLFSRGEKPKQSEAMIEKIIGAYKRARPYMPTKKYKEKPGYVDGIESQPPTSKAA